MWGNHRSGKRVLVHCDNQSVVDLWQHGPFYCPNLLALVLRLFFTAANINYTVVIRHIPPTPCLPITIKIISQMKSVLRERLDLSNNNRQMYWAAFTVAFFGAQNLRLRVPAIVTKIESYYALISQPMTTGIGCTSTLLKRTRSAWTSTHFLDRHTIQSVG